MRIFKKLLLALYILSTPLFASDVYNSHDEAEVRFIQNPKKGLDIAYQQELRNDPSWQSFFQQNGTWYVVFNEETGKPHRAFGQPITVMGVDGKERAMDFINNKLGVFEVPVAQLALSKSITSPSYEYVHFKQKYNGLDILNSHVYVKLTLDAKVVAFGLDIHNNINISTSPQLSEVDAANKATVGVTKAIQQTNVLPELKILPVPEDRKYNYKLVYEVLVKATDNEGIPSEYYTLVDANNGKVWYRYDKVFHSHGKAGGVQAAANTDINVDATIYPTHPYNPTTTEVLPNLKMVANSTTYYTDSVGYIGTSNSSAFPATFYLEGLWSKIVSSATTPMFTITLNPGTNNISFDAFASIRHRSAYRGVNIIHDYMKSFYPSFTGMDFSLTTNVDLTTGTCNAFYNGSSINFYTTAGGCNALSQVADVIYHEYGHGINDNFYSDHSASFSNGALNEGYADIWAMGITEDPVLGIGFSSSSPTTFIRRYDINKKVYPQDLVGEVHADGEIIAGAWWDTGLNLGDIQDMMSLYAETFYALIAGPNGNEGQLFVDVLIEALQADDVTARGGDNNIVNGTPNDSAIVTAFALHGISLLSNATINHTELTSANAGVGIPVNANITVQYAWSLSNAKLFYKLNNSPWSNTNMANGGGNNYSASVPSQPIGTLISYYIALEDAYGNVLGADPVLSTHTNQEPNIPYFILVGYNLLKNHDLDFDASLWIFGIPGDQATTGKWIQNTPIPSYLTPGVLSTQVQTGTQVTSGGWNCAVTGNANTASSPAGDQDVDGGTTTLESPVMDLSTYTDPCISYNRWYTNNQGANPGKDVWEVLISNNGTTWTRVERTHTPDKSWRRFAFRVSDYVTPTATTVIRFVAEDTVITGITGSLVEAAVDDMIIWDEVSTVGLEQSSIISTLEVYPNPAKERIKLFYNMTGYSDNLTLELKNMLGATVMNQSLGSAVMGINTYEVNTTDIVPGMYILTMTSEKGDRKQVRLTVN